MSVQMSQVLALTEDKAANSQLKLSFLPKTDSCIESWSKIGGRVLYKSSRLLAGGYSSKVFLVGCVCMCVHVCACIISVFD